MSAKGYLLVKATERDADAIRALIHKVGINPLGLDWHRFILAKDEHGLVVGCVQLKVHKGGIFELASLAVEEEWRQRGIARDLITAICVEAPPGWLYLTCRSGLFSFYRKFGFEGTVEIEMPSRYRRLVKTVGIFRRMKIMNESLMVMRKMI